MQRKPSSTSQDSDANVTGKTADQKTDEPVMNFGGKPYHHFQDGSVEIREAKVSSVSGSNLTPKVSTTESVERFDVGNKASPTKSTYSDVKTTSTFEYLPSTRCHCFKIFCLRQ
jgi:hypothetical protein